MESVRPEIDILTPGDIEALLEIEQENLSPWSRAQLLDELQLPHSWSFGAKMSGRLVGYVFGTTVVDEVEIRKLAVQNCWRRQGVASYLLKTVFLRLRQVGAVNCFLELRASNRAALKLYTQSGFCESGKRKGYYKCPVEDAILLHKVIVGEKFKRT